MNEEKCCWTCEYHYRFSKEYDSECDNEKSPYFQCEVLHSNVCEEYEESGWHKEERDRKKLTVTDKCLVDLGQVEGKAYEEAEPMAVLVMPWPENCYECDLRGLDDETDEPVCCAFNLTIRQYYAEKSKPDWCDLRKAIGIIELNGHLKYFREEEE